MRIIRFEDERGQVQYGLDKNIVQNGVASGRAELLGGNFFPRPFRLLHKKMVISLRRTT